MPRNSKYLAANQKIARIAKQDMLKSNHDKWLEDYIKNQTYNGQIMTDYIPSPAHHSLYVNNVNLKVLI